MERNHPVILAFDTGHLMQEPVDGVPRLDHSIGLGLMLARFAVMAGDLVGSYAFDSRPRQYLAPDRGMHAFRRLQQASAGIAYSNDETNFTLGLAELQTRLRRRSLIVLFTDFIDTVTSELLLENVRRIATRHLLIFVTIRDRLLRGHLRSAARRRRAGGACSARCGFSPGARHRAGKARAPRNPVPRSSACRVARGAAQPIPLDQAAGIVMTAAPLKEP